MRAVKALVTIVVLLAVAWIGAEVWGRRRLAAAEEGWRNDIVAERARVTALRMPVLRGEPVDENAAERYQSLLRPLGEALKQKAADYGALGKAKAAGPSQPLATDVAEYLEAHRAEVASLRAATLCTRVDWELRYEEGMSAEIPPLTAARTLANLLVLEGHEHVRAGDIQGGAERYLDTMRFGADIGTASVLIMNLVGMAISNMGSDALGVLLTSQENASLPLEPIAAELERLRPVLPGVADGIRGERMALIGLGAMLRRERLSRIAGGAGLGGFVPEWLIPGHVVVAHGISEMDPVLRKIERAAAVEGPAEYDRVQQELGTLVSKSWNPLTKIMLPSLARPRLSADELKARVRLVAAAASLEQGRRDSERYPAELPDAPVDPLAWPAKLQYQPSADGIAYKLWSVGSDRKNDDGTAQDLVLERRPAAIIEE